jgi:putative DNA methylase
MSHIRTPKKLIEVALPLDDINVASAREKSIRHGHPSTLHLWWARRPLAAARAVIFAQMVNDPGGERGYYAGKTRAQADAEREELFAIMRDLVLWENTNNEDVLARARAAIANSWRETCALNKSHPGHHPVQPRATARLSTTPLRAGARCRWRRSAWGWRALPATSTPWPSPSTRP